MNAHIGLDANSSLVHTVRGISGNVDDVTEGIPCRSKRCLYYPICRWFVTN